MRERKGQVDRVVMGEVGRQRWWWEVRYVRYSRNDGYVGAFRDRNWSAGRASPLLQEVTAGLPDPE